MLVAEAGFNWDTLAAINQTMSLFGSQRIVELRIPTGKPGKEGARVLEAVGASPSPDNVLIVSCPKLDKSGTASDWFVALEGAGVAVAIPLLERDNLPAWIAERLSRNGQRATNQVLQYLADLTEGNLLAAQQEIDKLALLLPAGELLDNLGRLSRRQRRCLHQPSARLWQRPTTGPPCTFPWRH